MSSFSEDDTSSRNNNNKPHRSEGFFSYILRGIKRISNSLPLATRFNIVILPLLLMIFIISYYAVQHHRKTTFDKQLGKLQNTFANIGHDQSAFILDLYRQKERQITDFLIEVSKVPLIKRDYVRLKKFVDIAVHSKTISYAAFFSHDNKLLVKSGKPDNKLVLYRHIIKNGQASLGVLVLGISDKALTEHSDRIETLADTQIVRLGSFLYGIQEDNQWIAMIVMSFLLGVIAFFISYLFHKFICDPLAEFILLMKKFQNRQYDQEVPNQDRADEIGGVYRALEIFRTKLIELDALEKEKEAKNKQLIHAKAEAERLAYTDELTGLPNRSCCQLDTLEKLSNATDNEKYALIYLDLNDFKRVNDTLGHSAGDSLLTEVGRRLGMLVRKNSGSKVYRWGGDEFVLIYDRENGTTEEFCREITESLGEQLQFGTHTLWPSGSLGIAQYPEDGAEFETLMICADLALHRTKESGRPGFHFFTKELKQKVDEETRIENELCTAIENKQLFLVYQPQIDSATCKIRGIEALIRWRHPERGVLTPWHFLDVVENSRLAPIVGAYVFHEAFQAARQWIDKNIYFGRIAVNLSPQHLKHGTLIHDLKSAMETYDISENYVSVEVLESLLLDHADERQQEFIATLNKMGVHIELDDFGTGYASLSHLSTLPINGLKIDRSFTNQLLTDEKKAIVIQSLLSLTKLLRIDLVCEGVETLGQMERIQTFGNCALQGYLIAKPMELEPMTTWLEEERNLQVVEGADVQEISA